jgi:ribosomal protein S18 acetylase RimI-like enzyme
MQLVKSQVLSQRRPKKMIRATIANDTAALMKIVESSGQFDADSLAHVKGTLLDYLASNSDGLWFTADDGEPVGVAYCAPEAVTNGTWNLLMLWTRQDKSSQGHGKALLNHLEGEFARRAARLLIVETSGLPVFEVARSFYSGCGFTPEARIRNFFADGDDKLVYTKSLG